MKQSIGLVFLQIISIVIGIISVFWIAASLPAKVYAITAIYSVINSIIITFSSTGLETYALRNVLAWKRNQEYKRIQIIVTQAIFIRLFVATFLIIPTIAYSYYISNNKFDGQYLSLFIAISLFGVILAVNDSMTLILKSFNKYFSAALNLFLITVVGRLVALIMFLKFGFMAYMYTVMLFPIVIMVPILIMLRKWIKFKLLLNREQILINLKLSRSFLFSSYISYIFNYAAQLIVTFTLSPELIASFSVGKKLFTMAKQFIENVFDPQIQKLVRLKNNTKELQHVFSKIMKIRNKLLIVGIVLIPILILYVNPIISFIGLSQYKNLNYLLVIIFVSELLHLAMKVKYNYISVFYHHVYYLKLTTANAIISLISFLVIIQFFSFKYIFSYIAITNFLLFLYSNYVYKTHGGVNYHLNEKV